MAGIESNYTVSQSAPSTAETKCSFLNKANANHLADQEDDVKRESLENFCFAMHLKSIEAKVDQLIALDNSQLTKELLQQTWFVDLTVIIGKERSNKLNEIAQATRYGKSVVREEEDGTIIDELIKTANPLLLSLKRSLHLYNNGPFDSMDLELCSLANQFKVPIAQKGATSEFLSRHIAYLKYLKVGAALPFIDEKGDKDALIVKDLIQGPGFQCIIAAPYKNPRDIRVLFQGTDFQNLDSIDHNLAESSGKRAFNLYKHKIMAKVCNYIGNIDNQNSCSIQFCGHSQGGGIAQLACAELANIMVDPSRLNLSKSAHKSLMKINTVNLAVWNAPAITYEDNDQFKESMQDLSKKGIPTFDLDFHKVDGDIVQQFGHAYLGYMSELDNLNLSVTKYIPKDLSIMDKLQFVPHRLNILGATSPDHPIEKTIRKEYNRRTLLQQHKVVIDNLKQDKRFAESSTIDKGDNRLEQEIKEHLELFNSKLAQDKSAVNCALARTVTQQVNAIAQKYFILAMKESKDRIHKGINIFNCQMLDVESNRSIAYKTSNPIIKAQIALFNMIRLGAGTTVLVSNVAAGAAIGSVAIVGAGIVGGVTRLASTDYDSAKEAARSVVNGAKEAAQSCINKLKDGDLLAKVKEALPQPQIVNKVTSAAKNAWSWLTGKKEEPVVASKIEAIQPEKQSAVVSISNAMAEASTKIASASYKVAKKAAEIIIDKANVTAQVCVDKGQEKGLLPKAETVNKVTSGVKSAFSWLTGKKQEPQKPAVPPKIELVQIPKLLASIDLAENVEFESVEVDSSKYAPGTPRELMLPTTEKIVVNIAPEIPMLVAVAPAAA